MKVLPYDILIFFLLLLLRMSSLCIHVMALLFRIEAANRNGLSNPACTSRQCVWNVPGEKALVQPTRICDMDFKASKFKKNMYLYERVYEFTYTLKAPWLYVKNLKKKLLDVTTHGISILARALSS